MLRWAGVGLARAAGQGGVRGQACAARPLAAAMSSLQLGPLAPASARHPMRSAPATAGVAAGQRSMSYFSGSHYDREHMREAKNPDLPKVTFARCGRPRVPTPPRLHSRPL